jgi:hypothetical protein
MKRKQELKLFLDEGKVWVKNHPQTTFFSATMLFVGVAYLVIVSQFVKMASQIIHGEILNPFTLDQVTGFSILAISMSMILLTLFVFYVIWPPLYEEMRSKEEKRRLKRNEAKPI